MGRVIAIIIIIIIVVNVNRNNRKKSSYWNHGTYNNNSPTPSKSSNNLKYLDLPELFDKYSEASDIPPLDSLVRRAYEKGDITSGRTTFQALNEEDKKTILRIAINIWNKRKKDKESEKQIKEKDASHYKY